MNRCARLILIIAALVICLAVVPIASAASPTLPSSDPFYAYSGSLAAAAPGAVLRSRTVNLAEGGNTTPVTATQLLYRTSNEQGQPSATVTTVLQPASSVIAPPKIVSYQTAYDALGSECDPSYTLQGGNSSYSTAQEEEQIILAYLAGGYTVIVPDYEGENLDWAAGQESGYNTLDGIRAAENFLKAPAATTPVGIVGYSGGSIATEFASELAPTYASQLDIVGVAEGGIPVDFFHNLSYINGSQDWSGVIPAVLVALGRAFNVDFSPYMSPYGLQVTDQVKDECINNFLGSYPGLTIQKLLAPQYQDYLKIPDFVSIADKLIMGRTGTPKGPLFMGVGNQDGTGDGVMVAKDVQELAHTYCQRGVSVQFNVYNGDDHDNAAIAFEPAALTFITERLDGQAVSNGCASIPAGNSLDPVPAPSAATTYTPPATPKLRWKSFGRVKRLHGIDIKLWTSTGTLKKVVVTLTRGRRRVARVRIAKLTRRHHRLVLRDHGRMPRPGRYALKVTEGSKLLLTRKLRFR